MSPPRVPLVSLPTPLHRLARASADLGIDLWIKRDDLSGFAGGGNKGRKLEYLMAEVLNAGADVVVSSGSSQSNFLRQLSCACQMFGIHCAAASMDLPFDKGAGKPTGRHVTQGGNRVLDEMFGLEMRVYPDDDWEVLDQHAKAIAEEYEQKGRTVRLIPTGGSTPTGAYGFYMAGNELSAQTKRPFDWIVTPTSSGSTHAGLGYCYFGSTTRVIGVSCDPEPELDQDLSRLAAGLDAITGLDKRMSASDFDFRLDFVGPGYGVASAAGDEAIRYLIAREGVLLDPVYSGKAFSGLLALVRSGELEGRGVFWHTGGLPTLFAT
ncbi:MAG TPA: pyridoxal-phosphate dependent enzyme [Fimbriimonadaceae bacterium]|nr:pyridoxal-phosphate dependent enzyme [Fimbriimonadaceae bacterium]